VRAFVLTGPRRAEVRDVDPPVAGPGQVVVDVTRAGVCGTDAEFYAGTMTYLHSGEAAYPMRIGHEWAGVVASVGPDVDPGWIGRPVTGDTMLGCGDCDRCRTGRGYLCADRYEIGIRRGWPGALAEQVPVPVTALAPLPDGLPPALGALVEPGGNALRAVRAARTSPGDRLLVLGPGTIGLLTAMFAAAEGAEVHVLGVEEASLAFARSVVGDRVWTRETLPHLRPDAVIDATDDPAAPALAVDLVEPGGRVALIGLSGEPSRIDTRTLVLRNVAVAGVLSASGGLADTIAAYASGRVDPRPLIAATVGLDEVAAVLAGTGAHDRVPGAPKTHVDPRI